MSRWCVVTICLVVVSSASGFWYHTARGFENEQFQANQQFQGQQGVHWSKTRVTPNLQGMVQQGLGMVEYDARNILIQEMRQRMVGTGLVYRVGFQNPSLQHNCIFQISYCATCSVSITPQTPACSTPCPGQVCRVDKSLRNLDLWFRSHRKSWQDRKYDEQDYEGHTINNSANEFNSNNGIQGMGSNFAMGMNGGMGMNSNMGMSGGVFK